MNAGASDNTQPRPSLPALKAEGAPEFGTAPDSLLPANAPQFADSQLPRVASGTPLQALEADMALALGSVGLLSVRAAVVDPDTLLASRRWTLRDAMAGADAGREPRPDAAFPGGAALVDRLGPQAGPETLSHRVSPRRWVLAWRIDAERVGLAVAHFATSRAVLELAEAGLVRLLCDAGLRTSAVLPAAPVPAPPSWPLVERRGRLVPRWITWPSLLLVLLAAVLAGWLAWLAVPAHREALNAQQAELARLHAMADSTVSRAVTVALASGDYGEVQSALDGFAALGYFDQAVVSNPSHRTVAWVGRALGVRIGETPPAELAQRAVTIPLMQGRVPIGQLLIARQPAVLDQASEVTSLQWRAAWVMAVASAAGLLMALRWPQRQRPVRRAR